jgi:hypothetical protein
MDSFYASNEEGLSGNSRILKDVSKKTQKIFLAEEQALAIYNKKKPIKEEVANNVGNFKHELSSRRFFLKVLILK